MFGSTRTWGSSRWTALCGAGVLVFGTVLVAAIAVAEPPDPLSDAGMSFDRALLKPLAERPAALGQAASSMRAVMESDLSSDRRGAAHYLNGQIYHALQNYGEAQSELEKATKRDGFELFADDAAFAEIVSMEAAGRDQEAVRAWDKWLKDYSSSSLVAEARLRLYWNAIRRGDMGRARGELDRLQTASSWMARDPRLTMARAMLDYLEERYDGALALLESADHGAAGAYLKGLCHLKLGQPLKAAAMFQQVVERDESSLLRDMAMLTKANIFLDSRAYRSAIEELARVVQNVSDENIRAEAQLRQAASFFFESDAAAATTRLHEVVATYPGTDQAARAQYLLGEVLASEEKYEDAIVEFNGVLTDYFEEELAATAQYRVARCLDALGRHSEATSTYQAVVSGYPQALEAPAAAYLAGAGLMEQKQYQQAVPYFQLVLDRYAIDSGEGSKLAFATPEHQELVEAALCFLQLAYHRSGNLGQLSGVPHMMLERMPPSHSPWRAYALLIDADAMASQARYDETQAILEGLLRDFPTHPAGVPASRLLAWTFAQQGDSERAIAIEEQMIARYAEQGTDTQMSSAFLNKAHVLFNAQDYENAAAAYELYLREFPEAPQRLMALYQAGFCYMRLDRNGDAVDRWEQIMQTAPSSPIAERAWMRGGDLYFRAEQYDDAKRCFQGLLANFAGSAAEPGAMLRIAQADYNAGRDAAALEQYSVVMERYPGTPEANEAQRGIESALYRLGQRDDGADVLAELVEQYPTSAFAADAQFEVALRHYEAEHYLEAAEAFRRVVSQFPGYASADRAHFLMAEAYNQGGSLDQARQGYEQFLLFFPDSEFETTVRFRLGTIRFDEGDYMRAAIDFTGVLESEETTEVTEAARFNLALCQKMIGDLETARATLEDFRAAGSADDERALDVAYHLGDIHEQAGRFEMAANEYELALSMQPPADMQLELWYRMGGCHEKLGDPVAARNVYKKAMGSADAHNAYRLACVARIAALAEEAQDFASALEAYRDLMQNSDDPELVAAATERASQLSGAISD